MYFVMEVAIIFVFMIVLRDAIAHMNKDKKKLLLLVIAVIYMILFENFNMILNAGKIGAYFYNANFILMIGRVPLCITLLWASLLYTAMHLTDKIGLKQFTKPFLDSLAVLLVSLMMDVVFVRQGVRAWTGYSYQQGWFGSPADYFIAVLFMTYIFSFLFRYFSRADNEIINKSTRAIYYFLMPAFAYLGMLVVFGGINLIEDVMKLSRREELFILWALVIFFALMLKLSKHRNSLFYSDRDTVYTIIFVRIIIVSYVIWGIVLSNVYKETILISILMVVSIAAEVLLYAEAFQDKDDEEDDGLYEAY